MFFSPNAFFCTRYSHSGHWYSYSYHMITYQVYRHSQQCLYVRGIVRVELYSYALFFHVVNSRFKILNHSGMVEPTVHISYRSLRQPTKETKDNEYARVHDHTKHGTQHAQRARSSSCCCVLHSGWCRYSQQSSNYMRCFFTATHDYIHNSEFNTKIQSISIFNSQVTGSFIHTKGHTAI